MSICVVGGSGFIGTRLCDRFAESGREFEIVDIVTRRKHAGRTREADIRDADGLRRALNGETIVHLAAVHRDDVRPLSLYADVNVRGTEVLCSIAEEKGINKIVFTSSVAVYGFTDPETPESGAINPFNEYGRTKYEAEKILRSWQAKDPASRCLVIIRPTVVFGEGNRGNVYNLLRQIHSGAFLMVGSGENRKSMAYVGNVAAFLDHVLNAGPGVQIYNYVDKPDFSMNELVALTRGVLFGKGSVGFRLPVWAGLAAGGLLDIAARATGRTFPLSSIRVRKFTATTTFASAAHDCEGFRAPFPIEEGIERTLNSEFISPAADREIFFTE
ncbi:MAG: NAD-dependent epimerase/dehydratase family protein [Parvibaculum sp.]|nr:NAD-dependent epimerase/dehydratase family protein [Parvibaculum sp.]